jgi:hypothetical protein
MEIIWLAIVIYSAGLGLVLYLRPPMMFNENGTWKEFGYKRDSRHTMLPFWLFAIGWALLSYALAAAFTMTLFSGAAAAAYFTHDPESDIETDIESEPEYVPEMELKQTPVSQKKPRPGYYVLNADTKRGGIRKYVYYGSTPPA